MQPKINRFDPAAFDPTFEELKDFIVGTTGQARFLARKDLLLDKISRRIDSNGL